MIDPPPLLDPCRCTARPAPSDLRRARDHDLWTRFALCRSCQDLAYRAFPDGAPRTAPRYAVRLGVLAAHGTALDKYARLPFRRGALDCAVAWETRAIVCVGARLPPLDRAPAFAVLGEPARTRPLRIPTAGVLERWLHRYPVLRQSAPPTVCVRLRRARSGGALALTRVIASRDAGPDHGPLHPPLEPQRECASRLLALPLRTAPSGRVGDTVLRPHLDRADAPAHGPHGRRPPLR